MSDSPILAGRRALITGGTGGLGQAMALEFARAGARVAICGRDMQRALDISRSLSEESGGSVLPVQLDLRQSGAATRAVDAAALDLGGLDILVNSAGAPADGRFETVSEQAWRDSYAVKFFGTVDVIRAALPHVKAAGGGVLIALSGIFGREPGVGNIVSGSINAALENFMKALASDVAAYGIRAVTVCPGPFYTDRIRNILMRRASDVGKPYEEVLKAEERSVPMGRFGRPEEFARFMTGIVSDQSAFLTGTTVTLDGGMRKSV